MVRQSFLIMVAVLAISGCAAKQPPKFLFPAGTRIGLLNHLEGYATHRHFSSLRFDSFSKKLEVGWNIPAYMEDKLTRTLQKDPRYAVIPMQAAAGSGGGGQRLDVVDQISMSGGIKPDVAGFLKALAEKYRVDIIIVIKSFRGPSAFKLDKHPIELEGYGLFTQAFLISRQAYAYANIAVIVFKTEPLTYIGSGEPRNKKSHLSNFDLSGNLKNMPQSQINELRPIILEYAEQAVTNALSDANISF